MLVGPLLARFGKGYIPKPGGDKIGRRRLDTHFEGFINLGAKFRYNREDYFYGVEAKELKGTYMLLDEASVTCILVTFDEASDTRILNNLPLGTRISYIH